ncbi:hypothetical protein D3C81_751830 [compost metagenome]
MTDRFMTGAQVGNPVVIIVEDIHIAALSGGRLELFYRVYFGSSEPRESQVLPLWVGEPAPELVRPTVPEAENDTLDPIGIVVATVEAPLYDGMAPGQTVFMEWLSPVEDADIFDSFPVQIADDVAFPVYEEDIVPSLGHEVRVRYFVTEPAERRRYSDFLHLGIGPVLSNPPRPRIEEANGDVLDLRSFQGNALATVAKWNGINLRQRYWFRCRGVDHEGNDKTIVLAERQLVAPGEVDLGIRATLTRFELQGFADLSEIVLEMLVGLREDAEEAEAIRFPLRRYQIRQLSVALTAPEITEARGAVLDLAYFNGDATVWMPPWAGIAEGQTIWISVIGRLASNQELKVWLAEAAPVTRQELGSGVSRALSRQTLNTLVHDSSLTIHVQVDPRGTGDLENAIDAPVRGYQLLTRSLAALAVSTGGITSNLLSSYWDFARETNAVTVIGVAGSAITLKLSGSASFADDSQERDVTLDGYGEARVTVKSTMPNATITASQTGYSDVIANLNFRTSFPVDDNDGLYNLRFNVASGARGDNRSINRCVFEGNFYTSNPNATVSVSGNARLVGYPEQTAIIRLPVTGGLTGVFFDVTNNLRQTVVVTVAHGSLRISKTMTFT